MKVCQRVIRKTDLSTRRILIDTRPSGPFLFSLMSWLNYEYKKQTYVDIIPFELAHTGNNVFPVERFDLADVDFERIFSVDFFRNVVR